MEEYKKYVVNIVISVFNETDELEKPEADEDFINDFVEYLTRQYGWGVVYTAEGTSDYLMGTVYECPKVFNEDKLRTMLEDIIKTVDEYIEKYDIDPNVAIDVQVSSYENREANTLGTILINPLSAMIVVDGDVLHFVEGIEGYTIEEL